MTPIPIFPVRSGKRRAHADGLSSDRIPAQDRFPDAGRFAEARAADPRALGGDGSLSPAARSVARAREIHSARRAALRQRRHPSRHRAQQDPQGRRQPRASDARQGRALCSGLGLPRPADRMDRRGEVPGEKPIEGQCPDRPVPPRMPRVRGALDRGAEARLQAARRRRRLGQSLYDDGLFGRGADRPRDRQVSGQWRALQGGEAGPVVGRRADRARRSRGRIPRPQIDDRLGALSDPARRAAGAGRRRGGDLDDNALDLAGQPRDRLQPRPRLRGDRGSTGRRKAAGRGRARLCWSPKPLVEELAARAGIEAHSVIDRFPGEALAGTIAAHPLRGQGYDFDVPLLAAGFVEADQGTGLVHIAPGHGADDFELGQANGLPVPDTVSADGVYLPMCRSSPGARSIGRTASRATPTRR